MNYTEQELLDKFGQVDIDGNITVDEFQLLKEIVDRGVYVLKEQEVLKEDLKEIVEFAKNQGFVKTEVSALIKHVYKNTISAEIETLQALQAKINELYVEGENDE